MAFDKNYQQNIYEELSRYLREKDFKKFTALVKAQEENNFYYNPLEIKDRFEILSLLLMDTIRDVSENYDTSALGKFIKILRFFNNYSLLERAISKEEHNLLREIKKDKIFVANLMDLFGKITNSFILYIIKDIPHHFNEFFINNPNSYFPDSDIFIHYIKNVFFNHYTIYGLSVCYLSSLEKFLKEISQGLEGLDFYDKSKTKEFVALDMKYEGSQFYISYGDSQQRVTLKKHLIYPKYLLKYNNEILYHKKDYEYKFYSLSMVLLGGIGPQGHGFTYSTPKGEVIEICSDIKENEAILIKYKLFLKEQFIKRLEKELISIDAHIRDRIISFLNSLITPNQLIGYRKIDYILVQINTFLHNFESQDGLDIKELFNIIADAISIILRPIRMVDQFKARMELVSENKLKSEDIAKLTSLRDKSHYDVLRERLLFQYIVDFFYEIYQKSKRKKEKS